MVVGEAVNVAASSRLMAKPDIWLAVRVPMEGRPTLLCDDGCVCCGCEAGGRMLLVDGLPSASDSADIRAAAPVVVGPAKSEKSETEPSSTPEYSAVDIRR
jgi:hypothetical protein